MSAVTEIEWADACWNFILGCTKISAGCASCYATQPVLRMAGNPNPKVSLPAAGLAYMQDNGLQNWTGEVRVIPERFGWPFEWAQAQKVFVNSLSDLFHEDVPASIIKRAFAIMAATPWHTYQALTKRSKRLAELSPELDWPQNLWMGVSVERQDYVHRIDDLRRTGAKTKFISFEPMIGPLEPDLTGIDLAITGGESGWRARPFNPAWALAVRDQCIAAGTKFFHKQHGSLVIGGKRKTKKLNGHKLDGREYRELPDIPVVPVPSKQIRMALKARLAPESQAELIQLGVRENVSPEPTHTVEVIVPFDYALLTTNEQGLVDDLAVEIRDFIRRGSEDALRIGTKLRAVKQVLGHGKFISWIHDEFAWSADTAQRLMKVADAFAEKPQAAAIGRTALYLLAGDDVTQAAREEAVERAERGEKITYTTACEIKKNHTPQPTVVVVSAALDSEEDDELDGEDDELSDDVKVIPVQVMPTPSAKTKTSKKTAGQSVPQNQSAVNGVAKKGESVVTPTMSLVPRTDATPTFEKLAGMLTDIAMLLPLEDSGKFYGWYDKLSIRKQWKLADQVAVAYRCLEAAISDVNFKPVE